MKKLAKRITGKEWGMIVLTILFTCFSVYLELEVPTYISQITELLGMSGTQLGELWSPAAKMKRKPIKTNQSSSQLVTRVHPTAFQTFPVIL